MAKKPKRGDIVYCEWLDHCSQDDWTDADEINEMEVTENENWWTLYG